jgi:transcriptional regulator with XRE-family HTH domain
MSGRVADLIQIPGSLWQRAAMIEALGNRDIGRAFRLLSQYAGLSQTRLAIACGMTQPKISGIMRGTARVEALEVFERIADGLDMPDPARLALGLAPAAPQLISHPKPAEPTAPPLYPPKGLSPSDALSLAMSSDGAFATRGPDAAAMAAFRSADLRVGGGHLYASVVTYLQADVGPRLFGGDDGCESTAVFAAAAALTEMAGWMAHDAGRDVAAKQHFGRSLSLAHVGGDHQLSAHVLGSMSHLATHLHQPEEAIALARQGQTTLQQTVPSPDLRARLLAMEARGNAERGEAAACTSLLTEAEALLSKPSPEQPSPWVSTFDPGSRDTHSPARQPGVWVCLATGQKRIVRPRRSSACGRPAGPGAEPSASSLWPKRS